MARGKLAGCQIVAAGKWSNDYTPENMKKRIENNGGRFRSSIVEGETTHLVVTEKFWLGKNEQVEEAKRLVAAGQPLKIVNYEWLQKTLEGDSKRSEAKFLWTTLDTARGRSNSARPSGSDNKLTMSSVFRDHTDNFIDQDEIDRAIRKRKQEDDFAKQEREQVKKEQIAKATAVERRDITSMFKKSGQESQKELFLANHHIHTSEGVTYDVTCTKIDDANSDEEQRTITFQVYESNAVPRTYALIIKYEATGSSITEEILACIGSNWDTTFRKFQTYFKKVTSVDWKDRIEFAEELQQRKQSSDRGSANATSKWDASLFIPQDFQSAPFRYQPPVYEQQCISDAFARATNSPATMLDLPNTDSHAVPATSAQFVEYQTAGQLMPKRSMLNPDSFHLHQTLESQYEGPHINAWGDLPAFRAEPGLDDDMHLESQTRASACLSEIEMQKDGAQRHQNAGAKRKVSKEFDGTLIKAMKAHAWETAKATLN